MTLDKYRGLADRMLGPFVSGAKRLGVSPDGVSVVAFVAAAAAAVVFYLAGSDPVPYLPGRRSARLRQRLARPGRRRACAGTRRQFERWRPARPRPDRYADIVLLVGLAAGIGRYDIGLAAVTAC